MQPKGRGLASNLSTAMASCVGKISTGDMNGNTDLLRSELRRVKCQHAFDEAAIKRGSHIAILPLLHYVALSYSKHVSALVLKACPDLGVRTDLRFVEGLWQLLRDTPWSYFPALSPAQYTTSEGFAERKVIILCEITRMFRQCHEEGFRRTKRRHRQKPELGRVPVEVSARP